MLKPCVPHDQHHSETALLVARGTRRLLRRLNFSTLTELPLLSGRRADIVALSTNGSFLIVEIKSSLNDFQADYKWHEYRTYCDRLYFAIPESVPADHMPQDAGLILADAYSADIVRHAPEHRMAAVTRRAMLLRFAHAAALRLQRAHRMAAVTRRAMLLRFAHAAALRLQRATDPETHAHGG
jgi:hypothetical protein